MIAIGGYDRWVVMSGNCTEGWPICDFSSRPALISLSRSNALTSWCVKWAGNVLLLNQADYFRDGWTWEGMAPKRH